MGVNSTCNNIHSLFFSYSLTSLAYNGQKGGKKENKMFLHKWSKENKLQLNNRISLSFAEFPTLKYYYIVHTVGKWRHFVWWDDDDVEGEV